MPPTEQERHCAKLVCQHLNRTSGGDWRMQCWLDDPHQDKPSPDVLLANGSDSITLEIKQLTDGDTFRKYEEAQQSLYESLAPNRDRSFELLPPPSIRLPITRSLLRKIRPRIATAATGLAVGASTMVSVPRQATVRYYPRPDGAGFIHCSHASSDEFLAVSPGVSGAFFVEEGDGPDHQFLTEECRSAFRRKLKQACRLSQRSGQAELRWSEEWELRRGVDPVAGEGGVHVAAIAADFMESAAIQSVKKEIAAAKEKFATKEWAGCAAVALHAGEQQHQLSPSLFADAVATLEPADVEPLVLVFLVSGDAVREFTPSR